VCVEPLNLGEGQLVSCRNCWQCRANRVNDLVGRCIAEQTASAASYAVTLTYAGDGPETAMLRYRDVQLMLKQLRWKGFSVRYIVAGEFGTKKGRAHWHAVLFFSCVGPKGPMPIPRRGNGPWDIQIGRRFQWKPWPHGLVFFQQPDYGGFAYCLKYALKDQSGAGGAGHLAMSKKPPLGDDYFRRLADQHVEQGLAPRDLSYSFSNVFDANKRRRRFLVQGKSRENYLNHFIERWELVHRTPHPITEEMTDHWDKLARADMAEALTDGEYFASKNQWPKYQPVAARARETFEQEEAWWDLVNVTTKKTVPIDLWDIVPVALIDAADLGPVDLTYGQYPDALGEALTLTWNEGENWWHVRDETQAERLLSWLRT
jgi:hypothetical protein